MGNGNVSGTLEAANPGAPFRFEASWQREGRAARWSALIWARDGILIGSPGGILVNAHATDLNDFVRKAVEQAIQKASRTSAFGERGQV